MAEGGTGGMSGVSERVTPDASLLNAFEPEWMRRTTSERGSAKQKNKRTLRWFMNFRSIFVAKNRETSVKRRLLHASGAAHSGAEWSGV